MCVFNISTKDLFNISCVKNLRLAFQIIPSIVVRSGRLSVMMSSSLISILFHCCYQINGVSTYQCGYYLCTVVHRARLAYCKVPANLLIDFLRFWRTGTDRYTSYRQIAFLFLSCITYVQFREFVMLSGDNWLLFTHKVA